MAGWRFPGSVGEDEQRRQRVDPAPEHGDRIEGRVVGPVHVLEHEDSRSRRSLELRQQQRVDVVRWRAGGECLLERRRDGSNEVSKRAERPGDREVVTGADEDSRRVVQIAHEARDQGGLADPRLAC